MLTLNAPAKINWFLKVLGLRNDGFHEIITLIQKITLYDVLTFAPSEDLILETDSRIPTEENLVFKAAMFLKNKYSVEAGALIYLDKNIPAGAGLGGGSSDAAATLCGLNKLWSLNLSGEDIFKAAKKLGSDVPFFLNGALSLAHGRGERIVSRKALKTVDILLVKPPFDVSTAWVYKTFSASGASVYENGKNPKSEQTQCELTKKAGKVNNIEHFISKIEKAELGYLADIASNDLELVTIKGFPVIAEIKERLLDAGAVCSLMSGSGSAVFGVFDSRKKAEVASRAFAGFWTVAVRTIID
jgi:4-diphosphocytidyl-2-C-methyl-D-erythritol kinase